MRGRSRAWVMVMVFEARAELRSAWTAEGGCPYANLDSRGRPSLQ
jgi:hypothetical protein